MASRALICGVFALRAFLVAGKALVLRAEGAVKALAVASFELKVSDTLAFAVDLFHIDVAYAIVGFKDFRELTRNTIMT